MNYIRNYALADNAYIIYVIMPWMIDRFRSLLRRHFFQSFIRYVMNPENASIIYVIMHSWTRYFMTIDRFIGLSLIDQFWDIGSLLFVWEIGSLIIYVALVWRVRGKTLSFVRQGPAGTHPRLGGWGWACRTLDNRVSLPNSRLKGEARRVR